MAACSSHNAITENTQSPRPELKMADVIPAKRTLTPTEKQQQKKQLDKDVSDVRVSTRLAESPCCLVAREYALSPAMVRMMKAMRQDVPEEKRILELNAAHPLVRKIAALAGDEQKDAISLLYDSALIAEGSPSADGAKFTKLLANLMLK